MAQVLAGRSARDRAALVGSRAGSHFIWFGPDCPEIAEKIKVFLTAG